MSIAYLLIVPAELIVQFCTAQFCTARAARADASAGAHTRVGRRGLDRSARPHARRARGPPVSHRVPAPHRRGHERPHHRQVCFV